jgi:ribosomal protein S18 acetylase RimI-like enzyme
VQPTITIRAVDDSDHQMLAAFVATVPPADRAFFKADAAPEELARRWTADGMLRFVAVDGEGAEQGIVGMVSVRPGVGAQAHVGEVTLLVSPSARRRGVGRALAKEALLRAVSAGLTHIYVEVAAEEVGTRHMFEQFGFMPEAVLRDFIRDANGDHHDLILLTHAVQEHWAEGHVLGLGGEL